jgi:hypothetical protein
MTASTSALRRSNKSKSSLAPGNRYSRLLNYFPNSPQLARRRKMRRSQLDWIDLAIHQLHGHGSERFEKKRVARLAASASLEEPVRQQAYR